MVLTVGPGHTLREAARLMAERARRRRRRAGPRRRRAPGSSPSATCSTSIGARPGPRRRARRRPPDLRRRLRGARLVARGGGRGDGPRRLPPPDRDRGRRDRRHPVRARRRALLDRGRRLATCRSRAQAPVRADAATAQGGLARPGGAAARSRRAPVVRRTPRGSGARCSRRASRDPADDDGRRQDGADDHEHDRRRDADERDRDADASAAAAGSSRRGGGSPRRRAGSRVRRGLMQT